MNHRISTLITSLLGAVTFFTVSMGEARTVEPEKIDPIRDAKFVSTLGLSGSDADWNDSIINILIVGQDARGGYQSGSRYRAASGEVVPGLGSRADGNVLFSFNKEKQQITILAIYRGVTVADTFWAGVADTPGPVTDLATGAMSPSGERYLANYYAIAGRAKYISFVRSTFEEFMVKQQLQDRFFTGGRLKIHGLVEANFKSFKGAFSQLASAFQSSLKVGFAMKGHATAFGTILMDRSKIMSELTIQDTDDMGDAAVTALRARKQYKAGGYQRSFNHAKFFTSVFGFFGYTMAEAEAPDILQEQAIVNVFNMFSHTFDLSLFDSRLRLPDRNLHILARSGFKNGASPVAVIQLGQTTSSYAIYQDGKFKTTGGTVSQIDPKIEIIPKANDCPACLPK